MGGVFTDISQSLTWVNREFAVELQKNKSRELRRSKSLIRQSKYYGRPYVDNLQSREQNSISKQSHHGEWTEVVTKETLVASDNSNAESI
jgi:hypothetical protein